VLSVVVTGAVVGGCSDGVTVVEIELELEDPGGVDTISQRDYNQLSFPFGVHKGV
jgi:hypothetical protein